ncbi:hypothetical protein B0H13DRAFT_1922924 [Mycena leptocephala]|nr:hypothetical protein B0H13DRAFT_1922924 [Mycena leptocephala]
MCPLREMYEDGNADDMGTIQVQTRPHTSYTLPPPPSLPAAVPPRAPQHVLATYHGFDTTPFSALLRGFPAVQCGIWMPVAQAKSEIFRSYVLALFTLVLACLVLSALAFTGPGPMDIHFHATQRNDVHATKEKFEPTQLAGCVDGFHAVSPGIRSTNGP